MRCRDPVESSSCLPSPAVNLHRFSSFPRLCREATARGHGVDVDRGPPSVLWGLRFPPARNAATWVIRWRYSSLHLLPTVSTHLPVSLTWFPERSSRPCPEPSRSPAHFRGRKTRVPGRLAVRCASSPAALNRPSQRLRLYTRPPRMSTIAAIDFMTARAAAIGPRETTHRDGQRPVPDPQRDLRTHLHQRDLTGYRAQTARASVGQPQRTSDRGGGGVEGGGTWRSEKAGRRGWT